MCGLFTFFRFGEDCEVDNERFFDCLDLIQHRGPDNTGFFSDEFVFMGHTRLSIVDLSSNADQPMQSDRFVLIFNGEIFNFLELREKLSNIGFRFKSTSDSEVILNSFLAWGLDCFNQFNGMWSLIIYDKENQSLIVSRDRFCQKPLFYTIINNAIMFASEVQQLTSFVDVKPNYEFIGNFVEEGDYFDDGQTFFENIFEFPPATVLKFSDNENWELKKYWEYPNFESRRGYSVSAATFWDIFHDAVRLRLRADVPMAILVSGGVDSTAVLNSVRQIQKDTRLDGFVYSTNTVGDEYFSAKTISDFYNLRLQKVELNLDTELLETVHLDVIRNLGRGNSSPAIIPFDKICSNIKSNNYKIVLDGQGADEILYGYNNNNIRLFIQNILSGKLNKCFWDFRRIIENGIFYELLLFLRFNINKKYRKFLRGILNLDITNRINVPNSAREPFVWNIDKVKEFSENSYLNRHLAERHQLGLRNLLYYGDIVSMKNSVELRSPFLDHRLVEYCLSSGDELKISKLLTKSCLKQAPDFVQFKDIFGGKKKGFETYFGKEFNNQMVNKIIASRISDWPCFSEKKLLKFLKNKDKGNGLNRRLYRLYQVALWKYLFLD